MPQSGNRDNSVTRFTAGISAILVLVPLAICPWVDSPLDLPKNLVFHSGVTVLLVASLNQAIRLPRPSCVISLGAILIAVGFLISTLRAVRPFESIAHGILLLSLAAWTWVCASHLKEKNARDTYVKVLLLVSVCQVVIGAFQAAAFLISPNHSPGLNAKLVFMGTLGNPEFLATWLAISAIVGIYSPLEGWSNKARTIILGLVVLGLLCTLSRGAILMFAIAIAIHERFRINLASRRWIAAALISCISIVALASLIPLPAVLVSTHSLKGRLFLWACTWEIVVSSSGLGVGLDNFAAHFFDAQRAVFNSGLWDSYFPNAAMATRAHNEYLDVLAEGGWVMLAGMLALAVGGAWALRQDTPESKPFRAALLYSALICLISFPIHVTANMVLVGFCIAAAIACTRRPELSENWAMTLRALMLTATIFGVFISGHQLYRSRKLLEARAAIDRNEFIRAERLLSAVHFTGAELRESQLMMARLLLHRFKPDEALAILKHRELTGREIDGLKLRGVALVDANRLDEALETYQILAETYPLHVTPRYQQGVIYLKMGRTVEGRRCLEEALERRGVSEKAKAEQEHARQLLAEIRSRQPT